MKKILISSTNIFPGITQLLEIISKIPGYQSIGEKSLLLKKLILLSLFGKDPRFWKDLCLFGFWKVFAS